MHFIMRREQRHCFHGLEDFIGLRAQDRIVRQAGGWPGIRVKSCVPAAMDETSLFTCTCTQARALQPSCMA